MSIKLIALDVDGTLVNRQQQVTPATVEALQAATDCGIHVVLATGRMLSECAGVLQQVPMIRYAITCTGTQTIDMATGETVARHSMTADDLRMLCSQLWDLDVLLQIFDDRDGLMHNSAACLAEAERFCGEAFAQSLRRYHAAEADLRAYVEAFTGPTNKLHMFFGTPGHREIALERLKDAPFEKMDSQHTDLECMPLGVDKGTGLKDLAEHLGLQPEEVMAIGDAGNDIGMLRVAGLPVAMGNGSAQVKALAKWVTDDNEHDGVGKAIRRVLEEQYHA